MNLSVHHLRTNEYTHCEKMMGLVPKIGTLGTLRNRIAAEPA
jgi:hypothetical protein